jgi:hypothetical protein
MFSPMRCGGDGGAITMGRPASNKPASIVVFNAPQILTQELYECLHGAGTCHRLG